MRNFGKFEIWSVKAWTLSGAMFGLAISVTAALNGSNLLTVLVAPPLLFALGANQAAEVHNKQLRRSQEGHRASRAPSGGPESSTYRHEWTLFDRFIIYVVAPFSILFGIVLLVTGEVLGLLFLAMALLGFATAALNKFVALRRARQ